VEPDKVYTWLHRENPEKFLQIDFEDLPYQPDGELNSIFNISHGNGAT